MKAQVCVGALGLAAGLFCGSLAAAPSVAAEAFCSATAAAQVEACRSEVRDDFFNTKAICLNVTDGQERLECLREAHSASEESRALCHEQRDARKALCRELGEARYDPDLDPGDFDHDFNRLSMSNPYFPLGIGNRWEFGGDEDVVIEVLNETKLIEGITCIVVNDVVKVGGRVVEDTDDWFAQQKNGDVYYFGEEVKDFEFFEGDDPQLPELVSIDGSFKVGRDGDKPGIGFFAAPVAGAVYRQEFSAGNAEDAARVLQASYRFGSSPTLDFLVPRDLAELLCAAGDCVVTGEFSPTEPGSFAHKFYARGVGKFLEVNPAHGSVNQLVGCNVNPICSLLPPL